MENPKRLYRSPSDRMLGGVCGGLAQYLGIDSVWVRLFFILLLLGQGIGLGIYLLLWIILPLEGSSQATTSETVHQNVSEIGDRARGLGSELRGGFQGTATNQSIILIGAALIVLGAIYLAQNLGFPWLDWLRFNVIWPALLIIAGIVLIIRRAQ